MVEKVPSLFYAPKSPEGDLFIYSILENTYREQEAKYKGISLKSELFLQPMRGLVNY